MNSLKNYKNEEFDTVNTTIFDSSELYYKRIETVNDVIDDLNNIGYEGWMCRFVQKSINYKCQEICKQENCEYIIFNLPVAFHHNEEFATWIQARGDKKTCQKDVIQIVYDIKTNQLYVTKYYITLNPTDIISKPCKMSLCNNTRKLYRLVIGYLDNETYETK